MVPITIVTGIYKPSYNWGGPTLRITTSLGQRNFFSCWYKHQQILESDVQNPHNRTFTNPCNWCFHIFPVSLQCWNPLGGDHAGCRWPSSGHGHLGPCAAWRGAWRVTHGLRWVNHWQKQGLPSAKHTKSYGKWPFMVDLASKNGDFP